jgi:hypothetical protein
MVSDRNWMLVEFRSNPYIDQQHHARRGFNISYWVVGEKPMRDGKVMRVLSTIYLSFRQSNVSRIDYNRLH